MRSGRTQGAGLLQMQVHGVGMWQDRASSDATWVIITVIAAPYANSYSGIPIASSRTKKSSCVRAICLCRPSDWVDDLAFAAPELMHGVKRATGFASAFTNFRTDPSRAGRTLTTNPIRRRCNQRDSIALRTPDQAVCVNADNRGPKFRRNQEIDQA